MDTFPPKPGGRLWTGCSQPRQWAYTPTLLNGVPVPVIMMVTVVFQLRERP